VNACVPVNEKIRRRHDGGGGLGSSILNVTFDWSDAASIAQFWSAVTGWPWSKQEMPGNPFWVVGEPSRTGPRLVFVNVAEATHALPKTKNKLHLDQRIGEDDVDTVVAKLTERGATFFRTGEQGPHSWVTMADPEGNEFCVSR
jgi:predicted enzyme related to lactoylglutathione lyase